MEGCADLELAGGFAGEVNEAGEVACAEGVEGDFEEYAGFAEARRRFEGDVAAGGEGGAELGAGGFLAGARGRECRMETESAEAEAGALAEIEKLGDAPEADAEKGVAFGGGERDGLGEAGASFDKEEFAAGAGGGGVEAVESEVGGELSEVGRVVGAEFVGGGGDGAGDGFDLAQDNVVGAREALVDAAL